MRRGGYFTLSLKNGVGAVELGLGVSRPELIDLVTDDKAGQDLIARLRPVLLAA